MRYRVRRLSTVGPGVVDRTHHGRGAAGVFNHMSDQAGAVFEIQAEELELGEEEITAQLASGRLKTTDLVFEGGGWTTFARSITFEEVAHGKAGGEALMRNAKYIAMGLGATVLVFGYMMLRFLAH